VHPARLPPDDLLRVCEETRTRRSGPGGQHRNKVETAVILHHRPSGVSAEASERRSQADNRRVALFRLRLRLAMLCREPPGTAPSPLWRSRVRDGRMMIAGDHDDYPALVAEALDRIAGDDLDMAAAAGALGVSPSQLVRLLEKEPATLAALNRLRAAAGLKPLR
jgi:hypothetical protein